jgi:hypothetical protein
MRDFSSLAKLAAITVVTAAIASALPAVPASAAGGGWTIDPGGHMDATLKTSGVPAVLADVTAKWSISCTKAEVQATLDKGHVAGPQIGTIIVFLLTDCSDGTVKAEVSFELTPWDLNASKYAAPVTTASMVSVHATIKAGPCMYILQGANGATKGYLPVEYNNTKQTFEVLSDSTATDLQIVTATPNCPGHVGDKFTLTTLLAVSPATRQVIMSP